MKILNVDSYQNLYESLTASKRSNLSKVLKKLVEPLTAEKLAAQEAFDY